MLSKGQILDMWAKEIKEGCNVDGITQSDITVLEIHPRGFANEYTYRFFKDANKAMEYQSSVNDDVDASCYILDGKEKSNAFYTAYFGVLEDHFVRDNGEYPTTIFTLKAKD
jgi:hypothetical protein